MVGRGSTTRETGGVRAAARACLALVARYYLYGWWTSRGADGGRGSYQYLGTHPICARADDFHREQAATGYVRLRCLPACLHTVRGKHGAHITFRDRASRELSEVPHDFVGANQNTWP